MSASVTFIQSCPVLACRAAAESRSQGCLMLALSPSHEKRLILLLAGMQFCHIVDFMVLMPLGPQLMRLLHIGPAEFGFLVAASTLSAGLAGFACAFIIDRFDRRRMLLAIFSGFLLATASCGLA